ncbi:MAG: hypothetical protein ACOX4P_05020 [Anaerovoracaceae bacterium]|jgi:RNA polymerase sigma factor
MRTIDNNVIKAKYDSDYLEEFIKKNEYFIMQTAYKTIGKYISKSDDQWSVSLSAFHEAIQTYSYEKGGFIPFAQLVIKRRLYDYIKKQSKCFCETPINPYTFENEINQEEEDLSIKAQVLDKTVTNFDHHEAKWEIEALSQVFKEYGFSFYDLISASPKAAKTKSACGKAIAFLSQKPLLLNAMRKSKYLPIKIIKENLHIPQKILERHRRYIIAGVEIVSGDYPILCEYFKYVKEEFSK